MSQTASPSPGPSTGPLNRHAPTAVEKQRMQLEKLLKDPSKAAYIPPPPKEKTIRPAREMMKNVQGSSAGAGSGEFHVYKASRRREYERLKMMEEKVQKESLEKEFEEKKRQRDEEADAKTAKNRAKRQKKKEKGKTMADSAASDGQRGDVSSAATTGSGSAPLKKRRLISGKEVVFKKPGEGEDNSDEDDGGAVVPQIGADSDELVRDTNDGAPVRIDEPRITIHDDD